MYDNTFHVRSSHSIDGQIFKNIWEPISVSRNLLSFSVQNTFFGSTLSSLIFFPLQLWCVTSVFHWLIAWCVISTIACNHLKSYFFNKIFGFTLWICIVYRVLQHFKMREKLVKKLTYIHQRESLSESQGINSTNSWLIEYFVVLWPYNFVTSEVS